MQVRYGFIGYEKMIKRILNYFNKQCTLKFSRKEDNKKFSTMLPKLKPCSICRSTTFFVANQEHTTNFWRNEVCYELPVIFVICESCGNHNKFTMLKMIPNDEFKIMPHLRVVK